MEQHCCFNTENIYVKSARIHVPLAEKCSMGCVYCGYKNDKNVCDSKNRPGVALKIVEGKESIEKYLDMFFLEYDKADIIGVSGPGDPLENIEELRNLVDLIKKKWSDKKLCVCTNGRLFYPYGKELVDSGVLEYITFTINTLNPQKVGEIYGFYANRNISETQKYIYDLLDAIRYCKQKKIKVKINTVFLSDINKEDVTTMYSQLLRENVDCFNLMPRRALKDTHLEQFDEYTQVWQKLKSMGFPLTHQCKMCRADFCGY